MRIVYVLLTMALLYMVIGSNAFSSTPPSAPKTIADWLADEFTPSTLSRDEQQAELDWFQQAAKPYRGMTIHVVSEDIATHRYESEVLAQAFYDITGIHVIHEITKEDDVVRKLQVQMDLGVGIYDAYVNDTDFIGTHSRYNKTIPISDWIAKDWQAITLPSLDLDDFIGLPFAKGIDGKLYQLPTQQFANLYWYRHDWFSDPELKRKFAQQFGYQLGVPQNWAAYQDIAHFFTNIVRYIDGKRVWGHMDYGHYEPSLGWRISDSWLSLAGANDIPAEASQPYRQQQGVGDWGIRVSSCHPVGASVARGGALDSPAAIYAVTTYIDWLYQFAPQQAVNQTFSTSSEFLATGAVAQQVFWYTAFIPSMLQQHLTDDSGKPVWRVAPSPRGKYWRPGMKSGYQDISGWTFLRSTPPDRTAAAWLYAQFVVSKTVSLKKFLTGYTPIRQSDLSAEYLTDKTEYFGGLLEFYRSKARNYWTPTGLSVPNYAALSSAWWQHIGPAVQRSLSVEQSMRALAEEMDRRLKQLSEQTDMQCGPKLTPVQAKNYWLQAPGAPWQEIKEPAKPVTLPYDEALKLWQE